MADQGYVGLTRSRQTQRKITGVEFDGPFFQYDPSRRFAENRRRYIQRVAQIGEAEVRRRIAAAPRKTPGPSYSAQYIKARTVSFRGKKWVGTTVVSAYGGIHNVLDAAHAQRVQATLAGRKDRIADLADGRRHPIGTTRGHEGTAHVFARSRYAVKRAMNQYIGMLLEGLR